jgi:hypothetical protein
MILPMPSGPDTVLLSEAKPIMREFYNIVTK